MSPPQTCREPVEVVLPECGVAVFESAHAEDFQAPVMRHPFHKLLVPVRGRGEVRMDQASLPLEAGRAVRIPGNRAHTLRDRPRAPLTLLAACFTPEALAPGGPDLAAGPLALGPAPPHHRAIAALLRRMLYEQSRRPAGWPWMLRGLLAEAMVTFFRAPRPDPGEVPPATAAVRRTLAHLENAFFDAPDLTTAAARAGLSRRRFTECFRRETGTSYRRHVERLRIDHARHLLRQTRRTVASIAFECGFADLSSFYRAFRRVEGRPPMALRRRS